MDNMRQEAGLPSVLVLDDEVDVADTLAAMVRSLGGAAHTSNTAAGFFAAWENLAPDIAIIDLQIPDRDGLDVLRELGSRGAAQVILSSGFDIRVLEAARQAAQASGLDVLGILPKPARRAVLRKLLNEAKFPSGALDSAKRSDAPFVPDRATLHEAITSGRISPHFQPKLRLRDRTLFGFEALARWDDPKLGMIFPDTFIPLVAMHGLDQEFAEKIFDQAVAFLCRLAMPNLTVSVNVPMHVCADASFAHFLQNLLVHYDIEHERLILEITEAGPVALSQEQVDALTRLRMLGFQLSIDDFGTGVSTLERLVRIPFNELKIDRRFTRDICNLPRAEQLVRHLVGIAKSMGMSTTIEGVEDARTMDLAGRIGCEFAQGYYIAKPMPEAKTQEWIAGRMEQQDRASTVDLASDE